MEKASEMPYSWLFVLDIDLKNDLLVQFKQFRTAKKARILVRRENSTGTERQRNDNGTTTERIFMETERQRNGILRKRHDNGTKTERLFDETRLESGQ